MIFIPAIFVFISRGCRKLGLLSRGIFAQLGGATVQLARPETDNLTANHVAFPTEHALRYAYLPVLGR